MRHHVNFRDLNRQAAPPTNDSPSPNGTARHDDAPIDAAPNGAASSSAFRREVAKLARHLADFKPDLVEVWGSLDELPRHGGFDAHLRVSLPTGTLNANARGLTRLGAWNAVADEMVARIERHKARFSSARVRERRRFAATSRNGDGGPNGVIDRAGEATMQHHLQASYPRLLDFVAGELALHESKGNLSPGFVEATEIVDDVAMRALLEASSRPADVSPDHWFIKLAYEQVLDAIDRDRARRDAPESESLDEVIPRSEGPEGLTDEEDLVREWIGPAPRRRVGHDIADPRT